MFNLFFLFFYCQLIAQPAPDFTITDSNGTIHELYADHLDQGKTVVLKFFFTYCPPCNAFAPQMEPFYAEWGSGIGDVQMISLSIMPDDSNQDVADYKNMHGHSWPGAGNNGGSITAAQPYLDDTWGNFLGTPTFAVLAPDGSVQFDPRGSGFSATLDSLRAAIRATGARLANDTISIAGSIEGLNNTDVAQVEIGILNAADSLDTSDQNGAFILFDTLDIFEEQEIQLVAKDTAQNSVNILDAVKIQRHIVNVVPFETPFERLAADVDRSGDISIIDVVEVLKYIKTLPSQLDNYPPWLFLEKDYEFTDPENPSNEVFGNAPPIIKFQPANSSLLELIGIRIGDVDGSAN